MTAADPETPTMTLEEYRTFERASDERHEFADGRLRFMLGGTRRHSKLGRNLINLLTGATDDSPCEVYTSDMRVRISERVQVYPDISVSCDERDVYDDGDDEIAYPCLVVEVLSPSTERIDRGRKLRDYQTCPFLQEYVMVNMEHQAVELYRRGKEGWTHHRFEGDADVELISIDARFPLTAVYRGTDVPVATTE